ncbi:MAG: ATP-binding cassette domain-containing protein [Candidatus Omnitrophica bacterium]|nr:ATP-binding cassette domain-containing protein [Candidatus Omnitrophota bacterium]
MKSVLVKINSLKKYFPVKRGLLYRVAGWIKAVDEVSLEIEQGKTLGLVGESGCGKTTLGRSILRLIEPDSGQIFFKERDITRISEAQMRRLRQEIQIVFQDPIDSLDPRFTVSRIVGEGLRIFKAWSKQEIEKRIRELLEIVGLPADAINRYPHEFSGGQRQRIGIARAISLNPSFLVLDEPVSSLDVSVQAQIINLFYELQEKLNLSYLFITHDLNVTRQVSDEVAVMYLGKIVECAGNEELFSKPRHPYTQVLLSAVPVSEPRQRRQRFLLKGEVASSLNPPLGCRFRTRCPHAMDICSRQEPQLQEVGLGHSVACHLLGVPTDKEKKRR